MKVVLSDRLRRCTPPAIRLWMTQGWLRISPGCGSSYFEGVVARKVFYQLRAHAGIQSRSGLPTEFPLILTFADGHEEKVMVPAEQHPAALILPRFDPPSLLSGKPSDGNYHLTTVRWMRASQAHDYFLKAKGASGSEVELFVMPQQFARFLAKIAHSYAVAQLGLTGFRPFLTDLILGRNLERGPEFIGGQREIPQPASGVLHELSLISHPHFISGKVGGVEIVGVFEHNSVSSHILTLGT
jgi:hypothetical protein